MPLVFDLHGHYAGSESPTDVAKRQVANPAEPEMADERGFIVIWPEATEIKTGDTESHSGAGIYCCTPALGHVDDVGFLRQVITWGETYGLVDKSLVCVNGFSNGAQMTHRMACEASDVVTAIPPVSWPINQSADQCKITHPMPVMEVHGTADETILYDGNSVPPKTLSDPPVTTGTQAAPRSGGRSISARRRHRRQRS
ncbi:MAG: alpha/beta hydrolase family esterase [Janthinobacterium lividum]